MSLRRFLARLILLCVLPLVLLAAYLAMESVRQTDAALDLAAADLAKNFKTVIDQRLTSRINALNMLALSPLADDRDRWKDLYQEARGFRESFGGEVILADKHLQMLFHTRMPFGTALPMLPNSKGRAATPAALATGKPAVGDVVEGPLAHEPLVAVAIPVVRQGTATMVIMTIIEFKDFQNRLDKMTLPAGWAVTLMDSTGAVIARRAPPGFNAATDVNETDRISLRSDISPWSVVLEIPRKVRHAPAVSAGAALAAVIALATLVAILGAALAGRHLTRNIAALAGARGVPPPDITEIAAARQQLDDSREGRTRAESAQEVSEKRFRATFEQAAVGIALIAPDGRWLQCNDKICEITGYSLAELETRTFQDITHPDDLDAQLACIEEMVAGKIETYSLEKRYIRKSGVVVWINLTVALVRQPDGSPEYFISIVEDINSRKEAQAALLAREGTLSEAQRLAHLGHWSWNLVTDKQLWSREVYRIYGRDHNLPPALYPEVRGYFTEASWRALSSAIEQARAQGTSYELDVEIIRGNGDHGWITVRGEPTQDATGKVVELHGTVQDITERKRTERELAEYRESLEALVAARTRELAEANRSLLQRAAEFNDLYDRAPCGYHSLSADGTVLAANATELGMLGYARDEFVGRRISEFMTPRSQETFASRFPEFKHTGQVRDLDLEFIRKDGRVLPVLVSGYVVRGQDGSFVASRATMVDNSEGKARALQIEEMQTELARRAQAAELATQAKSEFLANMSHEIRTPMNAIIGLTELATRSAHDAAQKEQLRKVRFAAKHLLQILNDILDLSKIEAGRLQITPRQFLMQDLFDDAMTLVAEKAQAKGLTLTCEIDHALSSTLTGDSLRIEQILINFASNAVKFTHQGSIAFKAQVLNEDAQGLFVQCEVTDTGIGIDPGSLDRLFDAFEQAETSTARRFGGTGLGLAISRRLADLMGGAAGARSTPGEGSTFWFTVRLHRGEVLNPTLPHVSGTHALPEELLRQHHGPARILITEDNEINQEVALGLLAVTQLQIDVASSGEQAIEMASKAQYDLILMDVQMPGMDGLQATRILRSMPAYATTPILAMTAAAFEEDRARCIEAGMNDHISKPVMPDALFKTLLYWLSQDTQQQVQLPADSTTHG